MDKKRIVASVAVFLILAVLVYLQYRHFRAFDWGTFWSQVHRIKKIRVLYGIAYIYIAYVMRAARWKIVADVSKFPSDMNRSWSASASQ